MKLLKKIKKSHLTLLAIIFLCLTGWLVFALTTDDVKGKELVLRKIYYFVARIAPIHPAVSLAVPYHRQEHALSCEAASLLMALNFKGVKVTETELIRALPVSDPGPRRADNTWGDPDLGFVGNIDGRMPNTGYGVYEQPIYDLALKYRSAKILSSGALADLIAELTNGNPVVVWGVSAGHRDISWKTPEGKVVAAQMDEHARTLVGFSGNSDQPQLLILLDPIYGEIRMKVADFLKNWALLGNRAVVVY
jgi:uncharacterized protein YvpB